MFLLISFSRGRLAKGSCCVRLQPGPRCQSRAILGPLQPHETLEIVLPDQLLGRDDPSSLPTNRFGTAISTVLCAGNLPATCQQPYRDEHHPPSILPTKQEPFASRSREKWKCTSQPPPLLNRFEHVLVRHRQTF